MMGGGCDHQYGEMPSGLPAGFVADAVERIFRLHFHPDGYATQTGGTKLPPDSRLSPLQAFPTKSGAFGSPETRWAYALDQATPVVRGADPGGSVNAPTWHGDPFPPRPFRFVSEKPHGVSPGKNATTHCYRGRVRRMLQASPHEPVDHQPEHQRYDRRPADHQR